MPSSNVAMPQTPTLTPQFCFSATALRDFLRISRSSVDDSIIQNLNALLTPSRDKFDPKSISIRLPHSQRQTKLTGESCKDFKKYMLFPAWQARSNVLSYCASVAISPDLDDPELIIRDLENEKQKETKVDERLDPYSARYIPRELRTERLSAIIHQELDVERIIRTRTWSLVTEHCGEEFKGFESAVTQWRRESGVK